MTEYKASLDKLTIVLTLVVFGLIIYTVWMCTTLAGTAPSNIRLGLKAGPILPIVVLFIAYLYRTLQYAVTENELIVERPIGKVKFRLQDIMDVKLLEEGELLGSIRTFGSGGFFGYYGKYYNRKYGSMTWYTTQRRNRILIKMRDGKKIVISPDDLSILERIKLPA